MFSGCFLNVSGLLRRVFTDQRPIIFLALTCELLEVHVVDGAEADFCANQSKGCRGDFSIVWLSSAGCSNASASLQYKKGFLLIGDTGPGCVSQPARGIPAATF
eukprot:s5340_g7.t1